MPNYIRTKQIDQTDLSGFFIDTIGSQSGLLLGYISGVILNETVLLTGNQNVSGIKTFLDGVNLNNIDNLNLSGIDITITSGTVILTNPVSAPNLFNISYSTGNQTISGVKTFATGIIAPNLVYNTGNQIVSGVKTFSDDLNISGDLTLNGGLYINDIEELNLIGANIYADNLVYNTGNQTISGVKTFLNNLNVSGDVTIAGTLRYNEIIDTTVTGSISGYTGIFQQVYANNLVYNTGNQTISGVKTFAIGIVAPNLVYNTGNQSIEGIKNINRPLYVNSINEFKTLFSYNFNTMVNQTGASVTPSFDLEANNVSAGNMTRSTGISGFSSTVGWGANAFSTTASTVELAIDPTRNEYYTIPFERGANRYFNMYGLEINSMGPLVVIRSPAGPKSIALMYGSSNNPNSATIIDSGINIIPTDTLDTDISPVFNQALKNNKIKLGPGGAQSNYLFLVPYQATGNGGTLRFVDQGFGTDLAFKGTHFSPYSSDSSLKINTDVKITDDFGAATLSLLNNPLSIVGSSNSYLQLNIQNRNTGTTATADLVVTANNGTDSGNYINLGINNSGYNDPAFSNGSGLDGYLFINGGNLDIGTQTANTKIEFHAGGTTADKTIAIISSSGLNIVSGYIFSTVNAGVIAGTNAQGQRPLTHQVNIITTNATSPGAVTLPVAPPGFSTRIMIRNTVANGLNVYPPAGARIDGLTINSPFGSSITQNNNKEFYSVSTGQWYSI